MGTYMLKVTIGENNWVQELWQDICKAMHITST